MPPKIRIRSTSGDNTLPSPSNLVVGFIRLHTPSLPAVSIMGCTPAPDPPCEVAISHTALPWTASNVPFLSERNELYRTPQISSGEIMPPQNGILVTTEVNAELAGYREGTTSLTKDENGVLFCRADIYDVN